jgi:hypothetical protein
MVMMTRKIRNYIFKRRMVAKKLITNRDSVSMAIVSCIHYCIHIHASIPQFASYIY